MTENEGKRIAVQIPLEQWEVIKAVLGSSDDQAETLEIVEDIPFMESIEKRRDQAKRKVGRRIEEIDV